MKVACHELRLMLAPKFSIEASIWAPRRAGVSTS